MADYIKREDAIAAFEKRCTFYRGKGFLVADFDKLFVEDKIVISKIPSADVRENVRGKWITKVYMHGDPNVGLKDMWVERLAEESNYYAHCSVCQGNALYNSDSELMLSDYCPNCGADMRGI